MLEIIQQVALIDTLIDNWEGVRVRLGEQESRLQDALGEVAAKLAGTSSTDTIAQIIGNLLDLLQNTPAHDYVKGLIARSQVGSLEPFKTREPRPEYLPMGEKGGAAGGALAPLTRTAQGAGQELGRLLAQPSNPVAVKVYFVTNRRPGNRLYEPFTGDPSDVLRYGLAEVTIPGGHRLGQLEQRAWWEVLHKRDDPRRYVVLAEVDTMTQEDLATRLAAEPDAHNGLLVFLHGYNVTFEEAARRAAQLAFDMQFSGQVLLFSWPSLGNLVDYSADEERALLSAETFRSFLMTLDAGPWRQVHLLAHSMGNRVMLHGLAGDRWPTSKLTHVIFAAADISVVLFKQLFPKISRQARLYSSYVSERDRALSWSSLLHKGERIGISHGEPFVTDGLETIDATYVDTSLLGHRYFADERSLVTDIGTLLRTGLNASERGLRYEPQRRYWYFPR